MTPNTTNPTAKPRPPRLRWNREAPLEQQLAVAQAALEKTSGNVTRAAELLKIQRTTLSMFLSRHAVRLELHNCVSCPKCGTRIPVRRKGETETAPEPEKG